ncbi:MAG: hypothetical protein K1X89_28940 [Myxococcaceae bacterium]|nr:hypothetical protein [Myxococcaceae bacterium]
MNARFLLSILVLGLLGGCGLFGSKNSRCDLRPASPQCTDWRDLTTPTMTVQSMLCDSLKATGSATFTDGQTCPAADCLGGCQGSFGGGGKQTNWFYKSDKFKTADDVKKACDSDMSFVASP